MTDKLQPTETGVTGGASSQRARGRAEVIQTLDRVWPARLPTRQIAGLPPEIAQGLLGRGKRGPLIQAARQLDRALPGWPEQAAAFLTSNGLTDEKAKRLCALLALRPLRQPEALMQTFTSSTDPEARLWLLAAVSGTDTSAVRTFWLTQLRRAVEVQPPAPEAALWFSFLRAFRGGWLSYQDFRDSLLQGSVLSVADPTGDYPRSLARLGLEDDAQFTKWYRQVVYDVTSEPDVSLSFGAGGWIRDFPGEDYFWEAVRGLSSKPDSWWPLHMLCYTCGINPEDPSFLARLGRLQPIILCLISLLRQDLCPAIARVTTAPNHEAAVAWLTTTSPTRPLDLRWLETRMRPWVEHLGETMTLAAGALCSVDPPADFPGPDDPLLRRREFVRTDLLPEFDWLMDNVLCIYALRNEHFDILCQRARKGHLTAIRALSLWPEQAAASAPLLFELSRGGSRPCRRAASESLEVLRAQARISDLTDYEKRLDLACAWADSGLEGKPSRIWWDVGGYRVKLSVAPGNVAVHVYSGHRRLAGLPKAVREHEDYPEIRNARANLAHSYRYFRRRFEEAMVEEVRYRGSEFATLLSNPVVRSLVSRLILLCDGSPFLWIPSDPLDEAKLPTELRDATEVMIAHPVALGACGVLDEWQQRVLDAHVSQPFKQVFREVYLPSEAERAAFACARFSGYQIVPRRAFALLRSRGYSPGRGDATKEWPNTDLHAIIRWALPEQDVGRLIADPKTVETLTTGHVCFFDSSGRSLLLGKAPPIMFSETVRDTDLLVSRAAAGEMGLTSEETLRLRTTLVRYLTRSLGLTNVYLADDSAHALVEGERAMYRVHLGSGSVLLENTRRHLHLGAATINPLGEVMSESIDSMTSRVLAVIAILSRDGEIIDQDFIAQL